jgi:nucleotide-binding universal stress UspA family protein
MVDRHTVVAAYNATDEAADGLALARLLAGLTDTEVLIVRVLENMVDSPVHDRAGEAAVRDVVGSTRRALIAALPDDSESPRIVPVLDASIARGLHEVATANNADYLVLGSSHHSRIGRILIGGSVELAVDHAPCPVAVAPPGFRDVEQMAPAVIGCAYDGSVASVDALHAAVDLARAGSMPLRILAVGDDVGEVLADGEKLAAEFGLGTVGIEPVALAGNPARNLVAESDGGIGMLVMGSRGLGPVRRALLGSVSTAVIRNARCPVLVTPRRD